MTEAMVVLGAFLAFLALAIAAMIYIYRPPAFVDAVFGPVAVLLLVAGVALIVAGLTWV